MISHLLKEWSKVRVPWFSKQYLNVGFPEEFKDLVEKQILLYELPSGEESVYEPRCQHGCSLVVEEVEGSLQAMCMEHPNEKAIYITEDYLTRYKFSIENLLKKIRTVNALEGEIMPCGAGYHLGYKKHGDTVIGLVIMPSITKDDLLTLSGIGVTLKEYHCIFFITPSLQVKWLWALPSLGDRIVLLDLDEVLDEKTFELSFDWGVFKLRQRGVVNDYHLEITGNIDNVGSHEIKINSVAVTLSFAPFLLLLRLFLGAVTEQNRWVSVTKLTSEGIDAGENVNQAIGRLKEKLKYYVDWDRFVENGRGKYRLSPNVTGLTFNRQKLLDQANGRITPLAQKLSQETKIEKRIGKRSRNKK